MIHKPTYNRGAPTLSAVRTCSLTSKKSDMDVKPRRRLRDSILRAAEGGLVQR